MFQEKYQAALNVISSITEKKDNLIEAAKDNIDIQKFLCSLYHICMTSAIKLAGKVQSPKDIIYKYSYNLAFLSLTFLKYIKTDKMEITIKILKKTKCYLQKLDYYNTEDVLKFFEVLRKILRILIPEFSESDYCLYTLHKVDTVKKFDSTLGCEIDRNCISISNLFFIMTGTNEKLQLYFKDICRIFLYYTKECFVKYEPMSEENLNLDTSKGKVAFFIYCIIFYHGVQHWLKLYEKNCNEIFSIQFLKKLINQTLILYRKYHL